jgi:acyl-CoA dehydrogenase
MNFEYSEKVQGLIKRVEDFLETHLFPIEIELNEQIENADNRWAIPQQIEDLKALAKSEGLWNLFLPDSEDGFGLTNLVSR